jgi:hypothetical protein
MSGRYWKIVPAEDVGTEMADARCVTERPRYATGGTKALLEYTEQVPDSVTLAEIAAILRTSDWQYDVLTD